MVAIGNRPDGLNINRDCGSTRPQALARAVLDAGADLGIAFDGDGDRVQMVDRNGEIVDGDELLYLLAVDWRQSGRLRGPLVGTLMSNYGLERAMRELDVPFLRANVGDRYVLQLLKQHGGVLGGETSGHILTLDRTSSGDAIVSALQVLDVLVRSGRRLDEAVAGCAKVAQTTVNVPVPTSTKPAAVVEDVDVQREYRRLCDALGDAGRVVLRPSGTEPLVRVTVEASDAANVANELAKVVTSTVAKLAPAPVAAAPASPAG